MSEEFKDINVGEYGALMADPIDKVLLIDADTIAFTACLAAEIEEQLLPPEFYNEGELEALKASGYYDEDTHTLFHTSIEDSLIQAESKLDKIRERTGASVVELHFTKGRMNFRYLINPEYKANRLGNRAPEGLGELKERLLDMYTGEMHEQWEADDMVVHKYKQNPDLYLLTAVDKDVLYSVPGTHWNYYESGAYNIDMKWVEVNDKQANYWPYVQCIAGDTGDNIFGPKGVGPKIMAKFFNGKPLPKELKIKKPDQVMIHLKDNLTDEELWDAVVEAYKSKGLTESDAKLVMRQVNLHQINEEGKLVLWNQNNLRKSH